MCGSLMTTYCIKFIFSKDQLKIVLRSVKKYKFLTPYCSDIWFASGDSSHARTISDIGANKRTEGTSSDYNDM